MLVSGSAFERQEESIKMFMGLAANRGIKEDSGNIKKILQFADDLKFDVESVMRIHAGLQSISPEQRKRIWYLYAKELGKVLVKAPKPFLNLDIRVPEPPEIEIKMCTTFTRLSGLEDKNTLYEAENFRDVFTKFTRYEDYDGAMDLVCAYLDDWAVKFFRTKDKSMSIVKVPKMSMSTHYAGDCPDARRFEYDFFDIESGKPRYSFIYTIGKIVKSQGNLPISEIVSLLKKIGAWER
jgi:hypothetical protein